MDSFDYRVDLWSVGCMVCQHIFFFFFLCLCVCGEVLMMDMNYRSILSYSHHTHSIRW